MSDTDYEDDSKDEDTSSDEELFDEDIIEPTWWLCQYDIRTYKTVLQSMQYSSLDTHQEIVETVIYLLAQRANVYDSDDEHFVLRLMNCLRTGDQNTVVMVYVLFYLAEIDSLTEDDKIHGEDSPFHIGSYPVLNDWIRGLNLWSVIAKIIETLQKIFSGEQVCAPYVSDVIPPDNLVRFMRKLQLLGFLNNMVMEEVLKFKIISGYISTLVKKLNPSYNMMLVDTGGADIEMKEPAGGYLSETCIAVAPPECIDPETSHVVWCQYIFSMWKKETPFVKEYYERVCNHLSGNNLKMFKETFNLQVMERMSKVLPFILNTNIEMILGSVLEGLVYISGDYSHLVRSKRRIERLIKRMIVDNVKYIVRSLGRAGIEIVNLRTTMYEKWYLYSRAQIHTVVEHRKAYILTVEEIYKTGTNVYTKTKIPIEHIPELDLQTKTLEEKWSNTFHIDFDFDPWPDVETIDELLEQL